VVRITRTIFGDVSYPNVERLETYCKLLCIMGVSVIVKDNKEKKVVFGPGPVI